MNTAVLLNLVLVAAMVIACAGLLVLVVTRRGGPGALCGCVVMGVAALAVTVFSLVPAVTGS